MDWSLLAQQLLLITRNTDHWRSLAGGMVWTGLI